MQFRKLHYYLAAAALAGLLLPALHAQTAGLGGATYVGPAVGLPDIDASLEPGAPDPCLQIANACTIAAIAPLTDINAKKVNYTRACAQSSVIAMDTNCVSGTIFFGGPTLTIPLFETAAASGGYPPVGSLVLGDQNGSGAEGLGRGTNGHNTLLQACTGTNTPAVGCVAPATRSFSITSTTVTIAGGRVYLAINATGMDLQAGEQIRIDGSTGAIDNNGAFRICTPTAGNSSKVNNDANCPAAPTSSTVYVVGGPTYAISSITGNGTTAVATLTCPASGLSCVPFITTQVMNFTGITNTGFNNSQVALTAVSNAAGTATVSYLNATNASSSGGFVTSTTPCSASCGTIYGGIPLLELGTGSTSNTNFGVAFRHFSINCNSVPSCVTFRNLTGQERVIVDDMSFRNSLERKVDIHTINAQNAGPLSNLELLATAGSTCAVGSTGFFFGDDGPRGLRGNITNNFAGCQAGMTPIAGGYIDASNYAMKVDLGHGENVQYGWICGQGSPCRGVEFDSWAGVPNNCLVTNCATASGPYAGNASANVLISNSFPSGTPSTSEYLLTNMQKQGSTNNIEDLITGNTSSDPFISSWQLDTNGGSQFFSTSDPLIGGSGSPVTTTGTQTLSNKTFVAPVLGAATGTSLALTSPVLPASGGTGLSTITAHGVMIGEGTGNVAPVAPSATTGLPLINTAAADPSYAVAGVVGGGTGLNTCILNGIITGGGGTSNLNCQAGMKVAAGVVTTYNALATAGQGVEWIPAATSQKAETTTADANVLTLTPPAAVGTYQACVVISVSAATSGVISWTLSWTDSNGTAQSNIAQDLFQQGTAAPNTTFTTSAAGNYNGCSTFDINNAAANIVVKWVGGGTTTAKMSAVIKRLI